MLVVHGWHEYRPRSAFVNHSTGPFTEIGSINSNYKDWVQAHVEICVGEIESQDTDYQGPRVEVLGCHLPEGKIIPMCGRTPYDWEPQRKPPGLKFCRFWDTQDEGAS